MFLSGNYDISAFFEEGDCLMKEKDQGIPDYFNIDQNKGLEDQLDFHYRFGFNGSQFRTNPSKDGVHDDESLHNQLDHSLSHSQNLLVENDYIFNENCVLTLHQNEPKDYFRDLTKHLIRNISHFENQEASSSAEADSIQISKGSVCSIPEQSDLDILINEEESMKINEILPNLQKNLLCSPSKKIKKLAREDKKNLERNLIYGENSLKNQKKSLNQNKSKKSVSTKTKNTSKLQIDGCNNIVKNYGKAMAAFSISNAGIPYLQSIIKANRVKYEDFSNFIYFHKESIDCIGSLRKMLLIDEEDSEQIIIFKNIFKHMSIIFLKYFAVNWIYNGKMTRKRDHLNCRFYLMRRVMNPSLFTYLR